MSDKREAEIEGLIAAWERQEINRAELESRVLRRLRRDLWRRITQHVLGILAIIGVYAAWLVLR